MSFPTKVINKLGSLFSYKCLINQRATGLHQSSIFEAKKKIDIDVPEKPKRPLSTYIRFLMKERPLILEKQPDLSQIDITRIIAKRWAEIDDEVKLNMLEEFRKDQEEYRNAINQYNTSLSSDQQEALKHNQKNAKAKKMKRSLKKKREQLEMPKKPPNPFIIFVQDKLKDSSTNVNYKEFLNEAKDEWHQLSENDKKKYVEEFANLNKEYKKDMHKWEEKMISEGQLDVIRQKNISRKRSTEDK